jgi:hypothetical protein
MDYSLLDACLPRSQFFPIKGNGPHTQATLPLDRMSKADKLRAMEELWADLSRDEVQIESPAWHGDVLHDREAAIKSGKESFMDWEAAKKQLRDKLT